MNGTVVSVVWERGFLFVVGEDGIRRFVHHTALVEIDIRQLSPGVNVEYDVATTSRGPRGLNVRLRN